MIKLFARGFLAAALALGYAAAPSAAEPFPSKPIRVIVPFQAGGGVDILIRAVAVELGKQWGHPVVVENRGGAGSLIGSEAVARAPADGYTLLATINQTVTANRFLYKKLPYDPDKSFEPISLMVMGDHLLLAHPGVPASNLRELVALARKEPGKLAYGSFGNGSQPQLVYELLKTREKLDLIHVPYKGVAPMLAAATAGEVQLGTGSAAVAGQLIRAGRLKPLAMAGRKRSTQFPDVPTTAEQGYPQLLAPVWYALLAPAGTPKAVVERISHDVNAILSRPDFARDQVSAKGLELAAGGPDEFRAAVKEEVEAIGEMVRAANIQPE